MLRNRRLAVVGPAVAALALLPFRLLSGPLSAQTTVVRSDRLLDVRRGVVLEAGAVVVDADRIVAAGPAAEIEWPDDARLLDLGDVTVLPGLIDLHTHLSVSLARGLPGSHRTLGEAALAGVPAADRTLRAGFTTVRDFGREAGVDLKRAVEAGWIRGPRIVPSRNPLSITGGHGDAARREMEPEDGVADGRQEVLQAVRHQIKHGAEVIKVMATAGVVSADRVVGAQQYSEAELRVIVEEARRHGIGVAAHAHGTRGILAAVRSGVTTVEHGSILTQEAIALMNRRGTVLVPTSYLVEALDLSLLPPAMREKAEKVLPLMRESHRRAIEAGVRIAFGTDAGVFPHGHNAREFRVLVDLGMEPIEAIRAATVRAAEVLGRSDLGSLDSGAVADVIAVPDDPLADVRVLERVGFVMKDGRVYRDDFSTTVAVDSEAADRTRSEVQNEPD